MPAILGKSNLMLKCMVNLKGFPFYGALFGLVMWPLLSKKILPGSALSSLSTLL